MGLSFWEEHFWFADYDFIIVGAGIVGLSTALNLKLKKPTLKIAVIDRNRTPLGASTKNAGFACFATVGEIVDDLENIPEEDVVKTIQMRWQGLKLLCENVGKKNMHYSECGGAEVFKSQENFEYYEDKLNHINLILKDITGNRETLEIRNNTETKLYSKMIFNSLEGSLNPVLMINTLISRLKKLGVDIFLGYNVESFNSVSGGIHVVISGFKPIKTSKIILCTNAFSKKFFPNMDVKAVRNQVLISKRVDRLKLNGTFHHDKGYIYFRNYGERLLIGGARNMDPDTETTENFDSNSKIIDHLSDFAEKYILDGPFEIEREWSGIIASGQSKKPIIKAVEANVYAAIRLGGMGVAIGSHVAKQVSDLAYSD